MLKSVDRCRMSWNSTEKVFLFSMTRLMFSDIKSDIGTSMGYMTEGMELLRVIGIYMEVGEGFNICNRAHIFDHFEQINSLII